MKPKCDRLFGGDSRVIGTTCTYICRGWPIRSENEEDGAPCAVINKGVCMNGQCVDIGLYATTTAQVLPSTSYRIAYTNAPTTSNSHAKTEGLSGREETALSRDHENDQLSSNSDVRYTTPTTHSVGSSFPTRVQARTTLQEFTTTRAPTPWEERSTANMNTVGKKALTSSPYQEDRLSSRMEETTIAETAVTHSTVETGSEDASTYSSLDFSVRYGKSHAHYDEMQTSTLARQDDGSTDGPTALSRHLRTSSGPNREEFGAPSSSPDSPFGMVSDEIPGFRESTNEETASTLDYTNWSTYDEPSATPGGNSTMSGGIGSSSTTLDDSSATGRSTASERDVGTRASADRGQAVTEGDEEDISVAHPTTLNSLLSDFSSPTSRDVESGSTDTEEPSTKITYTTKAESEARNSPVTANTTTTREKDENAPGLPAFTRQLSPLTRLTSEKLTSDSTSPRLSVGLNAFLAVLLFFSGFL